LSALNELNRGLSGDLLLAGMPDYDAARHIWNAAIDRRPALIVRCVDVRDIAHTMRFAERHNALVSVGGGATFADYDAATHEFGLASTGPIISVVGVGGYTLDGGVGRLHRRLGLVGLR